MTDLKAVREALGRCEGQEIPYNVIKIMNSTREMAYEIEQLRAKVARHEQGFEDAFRFMDERSEAYEILTKAYLGGNDGNE